MSFFTPVFRPDLQNPYQLLDLASKKLCHHYLDWNNKTNDFLIRTFLFLSYSFGIEKINTFKHSRCPLENHTRFQTKMGKVYVIVPVFRPKQRKNPILLFRAAHTYRAYIREYPLPPPLDNPFLTWKIQLSASFGHKEPEMQYSYESGIAQKYRQREGGTHLTDQ